MVSLPGTWGQCLCGVSSLTMRQGGQPLKGVPSAACGGASASETGHCALCPACECVAVSGAMGPGSRGGSLDGSGSTGSCIPVIPVREWTLITGVYVNYPGGSLSSHYLFLSFQKEAFFNLPVCSFPSGE